jgi:PAS domain S-box-containing protein
MRDAFLLLDAELRVTYVNARGRDNMRGNGQDAALALGRGVWDLFPVAEGAYVDREFKRAWDADGPVSFEYYHPDSKAYYEIDVMRHGDRLGVYWRDISARRLEDLGRAASEAELYATSRRLEELVDGAPLAILVVDNDARVLRWNPAAEEMFQWRADEVLGRVLPTIPPDERPHLESMRERVGESIRAIPARRLRKDGVALDVQVSTAPLRDASGTVTGVIGMITDVTEQRKLEAQLRMAQKMEAVGLLAGGVAHDFNNLLTAIKGFTSLLQMTVVADEQSAEFLGEISKAADRAATLTAQLLAFSRRQLLRPEALDLNARVRGIERMLRLLVRDEGELLLELDPSLAQVLADPGQVEQVIVNLAVNARDAIHGRAGGRVVIATSNVVLRDEFARWGVEAAPGPYVRLEVRDNGIGIDRATQARIFDPFFTTKEAGHGTGLGLATVFGIVKQSGGYVWVNSAPEQGAIFSVYLPAARVGLRATPASVPLANRGNELVLLVEDESSVRRVARRALELHGFRVLEASDGAEALALAETEKVDLLLTDVMMPGVPGPALVASLRERHPRLPALYMSGHTDDVVRSGLLDPATPFLAKPFTPSQLAHKVREALDNAHR